MKVEIARDTLDYVEAAGVLVSLLLAAAALWFAKRSADSAKGSADAAEVTAAAATQEAEQTRKLVRIARDQHERLLAEAGRRPVLATPKLAFQTTREPGDLTIDQIHSMGYQLLAGEQVPVLWPVVVRATFENVGDRSADHVLARFAVPIQVGLWRSGPQGEHAENVDLQRREAMTLAAEGGEFPAHAHAWRIPHLPPNQPEALHALLVFLHPGEYEAELQAEHEQAEAVSQRFRLTVPQQGPAHVEPV